VTLMTRSFSFARGTDTAQEILLTGLQTQHRAAPTGRAAKAKNL
jgi:hypothetical protein